MVDGTGMCGSCRVSVGGETKFACVDGPEFDAHQVDFDNLMQRQRIYTAQGRPRSSGSQSTGAAAARSSMGERPAGIGFTILRRWTPGSLVRPLPGRTLPPVQKPLCVKGCPVGIDIPGSSISCGQFPGGHTVSQDRTCSRPSAAGLP